MPATSTSLDQLAVDTIRLLSVDMVEAAKSGHPGLPLGCAPMAYSLWNRVLRFHPQEPTWFDRDRFILSAGHGSALLYSLLHVFGFDLPLDELKRFRQLHSATPGHPEFGETPGVEATTGPLGQGVANGVGMAIAEAWLAARYNVGSAKVIDHFTYVLASDGDLMEGVAQEAASLAGHLGLGKLIVLYDSNDISLDGPCSLSYSEDAKAKFAAMGWHVLHVADGNDLDAIEAAILEGQKVGDKPTLIEIKTVIGFGSPKAGSKDAHGAPLGPDATKATKTQLGWNPEESFIVPEEVAEISELKAARGDELIEAWSAELEKLETESPEKYAELQLILEGEFPETWQDDLDALEFSGKAATRNVGKEALNALAKQVPWIVGGAADLGSSTKTTIDQSPVFSKLDRSGRNLYYGVREHAMGGIINGLCYHGLAGFGSTFLVFSDYMRGSIRLSALTELAALYIFTHDSVMVGEDGPTHEPVEHVMSLRLVPGLDVYRPADAYETVEAYRNAVANGGPAAIILTRQDLPVLDQYKEKIRAQFEQGAYVLEPAKAEADVVLIATGSEVSLALKVAAKLRTAHQLDAQVVSMPCWEAFLSQEQEVIDTVLPPSVPRVSLEAGVTTGWERIIGLDGLSIGIDQFGASAPGEEVYEGLGFSVEAVVNQVVGFIDELQD